MYLSESRIRLTLALFPFCSHVGAGKPNGRRITGPTHTRRDPMTRSAKQWTAEQAIHRVEETHLMALDAAREVAETVEAVLLDITPAIRAHNPQAADDIVATVQEWMAAKLDWTEASKRLCESAQ